MWNYAWVFCLPHRQKLKKTLNRQTASEHLRQFQQHHLAWRFIKDALKQIETVPITNSHVYYQAYYGVSTLYWKVIHDGDQMSLK